MCHVYVYVCINWTISFYVFWFFMFMSSVEFKPGVNLTSIFVVLVIFFQSMVIPEKQISAFLFIGLWTLLSSFQVSKVSLSQTTGNGIED